MTEKEKYLKWVAEQEAKGLLDVNVFWNLNMIGEGTTEEQLYAELNKWNEAPKTKVSFEDGIYEDNVPRKDISEALAECKRLGKESGERIKRAFANNQ